MIDRLDPKVFKQDTENGNSVVSIFNTHLDAEDAVINLQRANFDITKLSIIGKDYHVWEHVASYYNTDDRIGDWGPLSGSAFLDIPGIGPIVAGGHLVGWIIGALEGALVVDGISAVGAALYSIGVPKDSVTKYENSIKSNQFLVIVHGTTREIERATDILQSGKPVETNVHHATHQ